MVRFIEWNSWLYWQAVISWEYYFCFSAACTYLFQRKGNKDSDGDTSTVSAAWSESLFRRIHTAFWGMLPIVIYSQAGNGDFRTEMLLGTRKLHQKLCEMYLLKILVPTFRVLIYPFCIFWRLLKAADLSVQCLSDLVSNNAKKLAEKPKHVRFKDDQNVLDLPTFPF